MSRKKGDQFEKKATLWLKKQKLIILKQNYSCQFGEIDIIAKDKNEYVFIEVKQRSSIQFGMACEMVSREKQKKIIKTAIIYLKQKYQNLDIPMRFDIISFQEQKISWLKNAFASA